MGTASTMTSLAEALGMMLPGAASIPAPDSRRLAAAESSGRRIVEMVREDLRPSRILTPEAFENAIRVLLALGGSTNAVIHLVAVAGRLGISLSLKKFDELSRQVPLIVNVQPSGQYLMEDFFYAGGVRAVLKELLPLLHADALTVTGKTLGENVKSANCYNQDVICPLDRPLRGDGALAVLYGNLAPCGAVMTVPLKPPGMRKPKPEPVPAPAPEREPLGGHRPQHRVPRLRRAMVDDLSRRRRPQPLFHRGSRLHQAPAAARRDRLGQRLAAAQRRPGPIRDCPAGARGATRPDEPP